MAKGHIGIRFTNESFKMRRQPPNPKRNFPFYMLPPCLTQQEGVARDEDLLVFLDWFLVQIFLLCFVIVVGDSRCSFWVFSSGYGFGRLCLPGVCDMIDLIQHKFRKWISSKKNKIRKWINIRTGFPVITSNWPKSWSKFSPTPNPQFMYCKSFFTFFFFLTHWIFMYWLGF